MVHLYHSNSFLVYEAVQDQSTEVYFIFHNVHTVLYFQEVQNIEQVTGN